MFRQIDKTYIVTKGDEMKRQFKDSTVVKKEIKRENIIGIESHYTKGEKIEWVKFINELGKESFCPKNEVRIIE